MAVDTKAKRLSIISFLDVTQPGTIAPDGTIGQGDRQALLWAYPGILWTDNTAVAYQYLHTRFRATASFEAEFYTTVNYNTRFRSSPSFEAEFH